jgi:predicted outer membrane repeat protein
MTKFASISTEANRAARRSHAHRVRSAGAGALLVTGSAAALLTALAGSAGASATITVDSNGDDTANASHCNDVTAGNCTLRDAALAAIDGDTITFDPSIANITLTEGTITTDAVNITGPGATALTITTTAAPGAYNLFLIDGTGDAVISGLTITKNRVKTQNSGTFTLEGVTISGSTADKGGALYGVSGGELKIIDSTFENNTASSDGGAINIHNGDNATISNSVFLNNETARRGGAIYTDYTDDVTLIDSEISGNTAAGRGGGIYFAQYNYNHVNIIGCTLDSNESGEYGGAVYFGESLNVVVSDTTVSNNTATGGAGLDFDSWNIDATINNSTITANTSSNGGAGIYINSRSSLTINQSTISANVAEGTAQQSYGGGGIAIGDDTSIVTLSGTIVSGNTAAIAGAADFGLYSKVVSDTGSFTATNSLLGEVDSRITANGTNNVTSTNPMLGALADNGGATKTMAPLTGSPAINAGPNPVATFTGNEFDQRGTGFARVVGGLVDIGAFEIQPPPEPTTTTTAPTTTTAGTDEPVAPSFTG